MKENIFKIADKMREREREMIMIEHKLKITRPWRKSNKMSWKFPMHSKCLIRTSFNRRAIVIVHFGLVVKANEKFYFIKLSRRLLYVFAIRMKCRNLGLILSWWCLRRITYERIIFLSLLFYAYFWIQVRLPTPVDWRLE